MSRFTLIAALLLAWSSLAFAEPATTAEKPPKPVAAKTHKADKESAKKESGDTENNDENAEPQFNMVVLQGLNKVTGNISKLEAPVGISMHFGKLEIVAHRCWKSAPEDSPENAALLEISELKPSEGPQRIFLGWMFSSSPGLSGLEHPVYDITVLSCEARNEPETKEDSN